jgi:hypothetical protein
MSDRAPGNAVCVYPTKFVFRGAPLAAWPIDSHFDLKYTYNPTTGEKTNVLEENEADRYWYDREYMRVAWGDNAVVNYQFTLSAIVGEVVMSVFQGDAAPEGQQFRVFRNEETDAPEYVDYVSDYILSAPTMWYEDLGGYVPLCLFYPWYIGGVFECFSEEISVRHAFLRVDPNDTYVPVQYDDQVMDKFGFFRQERQNYDPMYETTYTGIIRFIQRWDLWANHELKADGTEDYSKMDAKPIVYYLSEDFPRDLVPEAVAMGKDWARPFNDVVAFLKGKEAVPEKGMFVVCENNNTAAQAALDAGQPVAETEATAGCADMDYVKYNGDIRYTFMYSVNKPVMNGLLGYGPSSADPITGKVLSTSAYVYTPGVNLQANSWADRIEAIVGYKDYVTVVKGLDTSFEAYPEKLSIGYNPPPKNEEEARSIAAALVGDDIKKRISELGVDKTDIDFTSMRMDVLKQAPEMEQAMLIPEFASWLKEPNAGPQMEISKGQADRLALRNWANYKGLAKKRDALTFMAKNRMELSDWYDYAYMGVAKKWRTKYDEMLCGKVLSAAADGDTELPFDASIFNMTKGPCTKEQEGQVRGTEEAPRLHYYELYDPSRPEPGDTCQFVDQGGMSGYFWVNTCSTAKLGTLISTKLEFSEGAYEYEYWRPSPWYMDTRDDNVAKFQEFVRGVADGIRAEMIAEFRKVLFLSVATHEVGHTLGLRHNFEASSDAMNFRPRFWELRVAKSSDGKSTVPVGLFDQMTQYQVENSMTEWQYSSIMDYGLKLNDLLHGIGLYDEAAIKFGYGGIVQVFKQKPDVKDWMKYLADPQTDTDPTAKPPVRPDADLLEQLFKRVHYTQIPNVLGSVEKIYEREEMLFKDLVGKACTGDADCAADAGCPGCTECRTQLNGQYCSPPDKTEVPFRFCSDEYVQRTPYCDMWDVGVDPYEIVRNTANDYWWLWMFYGRWRGNPFYDGFFANNYNYRIAWFFNRMRTQFQWWAIEYARLNKGDWWQKAFGKRYEEDLNGGLTGTMATYEGFNTMTAVFGLPTSNGPGWARVYVYNKLTDRYEGQTSYNDEKVANFFFLEEDYGKFGPRPLYASWVFAANEMFAASGAAIYDRLQAFIALTDPTTDFLFTDEFPDTQKYLISYFTFFPEQMIRLLGGLTTHREVNYAPCVVEDEKGKAMYLKMRTALDDPETFCADGHYLEPEDVDYSFDTTWYRIPMLAAYYGMSLMINNYDRRFMDSTRVLLEGNKTDLEFPAGTPIAEFKDPMTGKVYLAAKSSDPDVFDTAYYLVNHAQEIMSGYETLEELQEAWVKGNKIYGPNDVKKVVGLLELLRGLNELYDFTTLGPLVVAPSGGTM